MKLVIKIFPKDDHHMISEGAQNLAFDRRSVWIIAGGVILSCATVAEGRFLVSMQSRSWPAQQGVIERAYVQNLGHNQKGNLRVADLIVFRSLSFVRRLDLEG